MENQRSDTLQKLILAQLMAGQRITTQTVLKSLGTTEARLFVSRIRKTVNVESVWINNGEHRYKEYFINQNVTAKQTNN